ncbi:hypothetical protein GB937_000689 [Aspergillus fischeri]|nr:hypothetical protein GB937_000689 [Aspergillus fischeri]
MLVARSFLTESRGSVRLSRKAKVLNRYLAIIMWCSEQWTKMPSTPERRLHLPAMRPYDSGRVIFMGSGHL